MIFSQFVILEYIPFIEAFWAVEFRFGELSMPYSGARN